jgi:ABC-type sugar transport system permease subunit
MNIKIARSVHLYLGCFFAPLLTIFIITGVVQTFNLHEARKNGYKPPTAIEVLSQIHENQRFATKEFRPESSAIFRYLVVAMSIGLLLNMYLGIVMAFKFADPKMVWFLIVVGVLVPAVILALPWLNKGAGQ